GGVAGRSSCPHYSWALMKQFPSSTSHFLKRRRLMSESFAVTDLVAAITGSAAAFVLSPGLSERPPGFGRQVADCMLMDSVQSQANRAEEALKLAIERDRIKLPLIEVDFQDANSKLRNPLQNLTSLDARISCRNRSEFPPSIDRGF